MNNEIIEEEKIFNHLEPIQDFFDWSENHDYPSPFTLFLDLIGYSQEEFGETFTTLDQVVNKLGYLELGYLGEALVTYSDRPQESLDFIALLLKIEEEE